MQSAIRFSRSSSASGSSTAGAASAALREVSPIPERHGGAPASASSAAASRASRTSLSRTSAARVSVPDASVDGAHFAPHHVRAAGEAPHAARPMPSSFPGSAAPHDAPARSRSRSTSRSTRGLSHDATGSSSSSSRRRNAAHVTAGPMSMSVPWIPPPPIYGVPLPDGANRNPYYAHYYDPIAVGGEAGGPPGAQWWPFRYPDDVPPPPAPMPQSSATGVRHRVTPHQGHALQWPAWSEWPTPDALPLPSAFPLPPRVLSQQPRQHDQHAAPPQPPVRASAAAAATHPTFSLPPPPMPWWAWWPPMPPPFPPRCPSSSSSSASRSSSSSHGSSTSSGDSSARRTPRSAPRRPAAHRATAQRTPLPSSTRASPPPRGAAGLPMGSVVTPIAAGAAARHAERPPLQPRQAQQRRNPRVDVDASEADAASSVTHSHSIPASSSDGGFARRGGAVERRVYASDSGSGSSGAQPPPPLRRPPHHHPASAAPQGGKQAAAEDEDDVADTAEDAVRVRHTMNAAAAYLGKMEQLYQRLRHRYEEVLMSPERAVSDMERDPAPPVAAPPPRRVGPPPAQHTPPAALHDGHLREEVQPASVLRPTGSRDAHRAPPVLKSPGASPAPRPHPSPPPLTSSSAASGSSAASSASSLRQELQLLESQWLRLEEMKQRPGSCTARTFSMTPAAVGAQAAGQSGSGVAPESLLQLIHDRKRLLTTAP